MNSECAQADKALALRGILDHSQFEFDDYSHRGFLKIRCSFEGAIKLIVKDIHGSSDNNDDNNDLSEAATALYLVNLPGLKLQSYLPKSYPFQRPPDFFIQCTWLDGSDFRKTRRKLSLIWYSSESEILFDWFSVLQNDPITYLGYEHGIVLKKSLEKCKFWGDFSAPFDESFSPGYIFELIR